MTAAGGCGPDRGTDTGRADSNFIAASSCGPDRSTDTGPVIFAPCIMQQDRAAGAGSQEAHEQEGL